MKSIIAILLISILGFLGCSDSNDATSAVSVEAIPVAPFGIIDSFTPSYEWTPVPGATEYRLLVEDADETYVIQESYTAEESGCASEEIMCMVTPDIEVFDKNTWKIQACDNQECGLWSESLNFYASPTNDAGFIINDDNTVTDERTGLIWMRNADRWISQPYTFLLQPWTCGTLPGPCPWRLPTLSELTSLKKTGRRIPMIREPNPFSGVLRPDPLPSHGFYKYFWTTTYYPRPWWKEPYPGWTYNYIVEFYDGKECVARTYGLGVNYHVWCVTTCR